MGNLLNSSHNFPTFSLSCTRNGAPYFLLVLFLTLNMYKKWLEKVSRHSPFIVVMSCKQFVYSTSLTIKLRISTDNSRHSVKCVPKVEYFKFSSTEIALSVEFLLLDPTSASLIYQ